MLLIDSHKPESVQVLVAENRQLRIKIGQLARALDNILCVNDCQGVWGLAGGQEFEDARQILAEVNRKWGVLNAADRQS